MDRTTAVYDGKVLVLQEPVDWAEGTVVNVSPSNKTLGWVGQMTADEAFEWLLNNPRHGGGAEFDRGDLYP